MLKKTVQLMDRDFYEILGVPPIADKEEIRQAYLRLARKYHPDMSPAPADRELFEKINEAYTTLIDDESRYRYNLNRKEDGKEDEVMEVPQEDPVWPRQKSWAEEKALVVIVGLMGLVSLVVVGLLCNGPFLEEELDTLSTMLQAKKAEFELSQQKRDQAPAVPEKLDEASAPSPVTATAKTEPQAAPLPSEPKLSTTNVPQEVEKALGTDSMNTVEKAPDLAVQPTQPPDANAAARNYEVLAFYSLIIGDLNQFKNAIERASQEDPSYPKINALHLSFQQLESAKLPPEHILRVLRGLVFREYTDRLLPSQLKALQSYAKDDEV